MTREEAKEIIGAMSWELYNQEVSDEKTIEALNMAIEALEEKYPCGLCKWYEDKEDWGGYVSIAQQSRKVVMKNEHTRSD